MIRLVEYPVSDDGSILVEVNLPQAEGQLVPAGTPGELITKAEESFEAAIRRVVPAATIAMKEIRTRLDSPAEVALEFGLKLTGGTNVILAAAQGEANFKVKLSWKGTAQ